MSLMFQPLKKYFDVQGRARRAEYWLFMLFMIGVFIATSIMDGTVQGYGPASMIALCLLLIPSVTLSVRRLHDLGLSGFLVLIQFIPVIGPVALAIMFMFPGTPGWNKYGPDPITRA